MTTDTHKGGNPAAATAGRVKGRLLLLAIVASLGPARSAVTLTIREVLAYE